MTNKPGKQKLILLLAQAMLFFLSLACSLTAVRPSSGNLLAENSTQPQQRATATVASKPTITATSTRSSCSVTAENLNLRTGPGVGYAIKASLPAGTTLSPLPSPGADGWLWVQVGGQSGYVNSKFTNCQRK